MTTPPASPTVTEASPTLEEQIRCIAEDIEVVLPYAMDSAILASLRDLTAARQRIERLEARVDGLRAHAIKYVDPLMGSDAAAKDAEDFVDNRLAMHGEKHSALENIFPCDMGMLLNALKSYRIRTFRGESRLAAVEAESKQVRLATIEEAAKVCDAVQQKSYLTVAQHCAAAIRHLKEKS